MVRTLYVGSLAALLSGLALADHAMPFGCPADFTYDEVVNDADFVVFLAAYNGLVCP